MSQWIARSRLDQAASPVKSLSAWGKGDGRASHHVALQSLARKPGRAKNRTTGMCANERTPAVGALGYTRRLRSTLQATFFFTRRRRFAATSLPDPGRGSSLFATARGALIRTAFALMHRHTRARSHTWTGDIHRRSSRQGLGEEDEQTRVVRWTLVGRS